MVHPRLTTCLALVIALTSTGTAGEPPGYYDGVDASNPAALRQTLHAVIDDHTRFPYTSGATDTWNILELAQEDPANSSRVIDVYRNASFPKQGGGNSFYDREHSWPKSYGFPDNDSSNVPYTDCHLLFLCDGNYNQARSNKPFRFCTSGCSEFATDQNGGQGGQGGGYPGDSNWTSGAFTAGRWETWLGKRGDVARAMFYADVRYEGGIHTGLGVSEPDLILTDVESLIDGSNTGNNLSVAYMGMLSDLLQWHIQDPPDAHEMMRNDIVYSFQGNRNPFVDHPEWVACLFSGSCAGDTTPPAAPTGLVATAGNGLVQLHWNDNGESDLAGYRVYRQSGGGAFVEIGGGIVVPSNFTDFGVTNGVTYAYHVTAEDASGNESSPSATDSATPQGGGGPAVTWINEFHYDNSGADVGEFVEVAGPAGTLLTGWSVVGYNGATGGVYKTESLSGVIPDQQGGYGTASFAFSSMQNGAPDGLALVDHTGVVLEFLSYEGTIQALGGPAAGLTSTDVLVSESGGTLIGQSLQRVGSGTQGSDFTWQSPANDSPGQVNVGQSLGAGDTTPPGAPTGLVVQSVAATSVALDWADNAEGDLAGYDVHRGTMPGGPYAKLNGPLLGASQYTDASVTAGVTYFYVVTASDQSGNQSADSAEVSASPVLCQADLGFGNHPTAALSVCGGDLSTGSDATMSLTGIPVTAQILMFVGLSSNPVAVPELNGATLVPIPPVFVVTLPNFGTGALDLNVPGGGGAFSIYVQAALIDPSVKATTNALRVDILP